MIICYQVEIVANYKRSHSLPLKKHLFLEYAMFPMRVGNIGLEANVPARCHCFVASSMSALQLTTLMRNIAFLKQPFVYAVACNLYDNYRIHKYL